MFGIDWVIWGVIAAVVVPVALYIREGRARIKVSGTVDKTGFVEAVIVKRGRGKGHINSLELVDPGANTRLPLMSRSRIGPIELDEGDVDVRAYFQLATAPRRGAVIEALIRHGKRDRRVKIIWTDKPIVLQDGTTMIDMRAPKPKAPDVQTNATGGGTEPAPKSGAATPDQSDPDKRT